jgi:hypothetical protein
MRPGGGSWERKVYIKIKWLAYAAPIERAVDNLLSRLIKACYDRRESSDGGGNRNTRVESINGGENGRLREGSVS